MKTKILFMAALTVGLFWACQTDSVDVAIEDSSFKEIPVKEPLYLDLGSTIKTISNSNHAEEVFKSSETKRVALYMAEYLTSGDNEEIGNEIYFMNNGNKQLAGDFAPDIYAGDTDGTNDISYYVDDNKPSADLPVADSNAAIDRAMATWDGVTCSEMGIFEIPFDGRPTGFILALLGGPGSFDYVADVVHSGWLPAIFFDIIAPNGSQYILGATFTIIWVDENGDPIDLDKNGKYDVAWREIYYNDAFTWQDGAHYDVETIALHESGHGLSQAHFGKAFRTTSNGKLHFAPRALMNAAYSGIQTTVTKSDNAGHCSNWAQWPKN